MSTAPINLYMDLEPGTLPDLEVVARASLALTAAIKDAAFRLDPSADIRVELVSGTEGSFSLNGIIRSLRETSANHPLAAGVAAGALTWFGGYTATEIANELRDARVELTDVQIDEIARRTADELEKRRVNPHAREVYRELSQDKAIKGVGASMSEGRRPRHVIPRSEFPERSRVDFALTAQGVELPKRRVRERRQTVVVISPVLLRGDRRWKLRSYEGEFGASMRDQQFLDHILSGRRTLPTVEGVQLDANIETVDIWTGTAWMPAEHAVTQVFDVILPSVQTELLLSPPNQKPKRARKGKSKNNN